VIFNPSDMYLETCETICVTRFTWKTFGSTISLVKLTKANAACSQVLALFGQGRSHLSEPKTYGQIEKNYLLVWSREFN